MTRDFCAHERPPPTERFAPEGVQGGDRNDGKRPAQPHRIADPVHDRGDGTGQVSEGEPDPFVDGTLDRKGRAQFGRQQTVGNEERDAGNDEPEDRLGPLGRNGAECVERHDASDGEEHEVPAKERLAQLAFFGEYVSRRLQDRQCLPSLSVIGSWAEPVRNLNLP